MLSLMLQRRSCERRPLRIAARIWRIVAALLIVALACPAYGQRQGQNQVPRYTPQSPTVSPYLNLLSRNGSAAGNYFGLVRPLQRQQGFNQNTQLQSYGQQEEIQRLRSQQDAFDQPIVKPTGTAGWFQNPGQPALPANRPLLWPVANGRRSSAPGGAALTCRLRLPQWLGSIAAVKLCDGLHCRTTRIDSRSAGRCGRRRPRPRWAVP